MKQINERVKSGQTIYKSTTKIQNPKSKIKRKGKRKKKKKNNASIYKPREINLREINPKETNQ